MIDSDPGIFNFDRYAVIAAAQAVFGGGVGVFLWTGVMGGWQMEDGESIANWPGLGK